MNSQNIPPHESVIEIPLSQGQVAIIDAKNGDLLGWKWSARKSKGKFYALRTAHVGERKFTMLLHRVVLSRKLGRALHPKEEVDHIDLDGLNNCESNLRLANDAENMRNRPRRSDNTSGYKGVGFDQITQKWRARIGVNKERRHLGYFDTPEEAYKAYCQAAEKLHGEFARFG